MRLLIEHASEGIPRRLLRGERAIQKQALFLHGSNSPQLAAESFN
jgi:hypothetical protein